MALKRVKLNYIQLIPNIEPKEKIKVSSAALEELDRAIQEKTKQNADYFNMVRGTFEDGIVK